MNLDFDLNILRLNENNFICVEEKGRIDYIKVENYENFVLLIEAYKDFCTAHGRDSFYYAEKVTEEERQYFLEYGFKEDGVIDREGNEYVFYTLWL